MDPIGNQQYMVNICVVLLSQMSYVDHFKRRVCRSENGVYILIYVIIFRPCLPRSMIEWILVGG